MKNIDTENLTTEQKLEILSSGLVKLIEQHEKLEKKASVIQAVTVDLAIEAGIGHERFMKMVEHNVKLVEGWAEEREKEAELTEADVEALQNAIHEMENGSPLEEALVKARAMKEKMEEAGNGVH